MNCVGWLWSTNSSCCSSKATALGPPASWLPRVVRSSSIFPFSFPLFFLSFPGWGRLTRLSRARTAAERRDDGVDNTFCILDISPAELARYAPLLPSPTGAAPSAQSADLCCGAWGACAHRLQGTDVDRVRHFWQSDAARTPLVLLEGPSGEHQGHHRPLQRGTNKSYSYSSDYYNSEKPIH